MNRRKVRLGLGLAVAVAVLVAVVLPPLARPRALHAQNDVTLAIDAQPAGNTGSHLGPIDPCVSTAVSDVFGVDLVIINVHDLLAWEAYVTYDPAVLELTDRNVRLFQSANDGSNVVDVSDATPDTDGTYRAAAADTADPASPDSGSGVLARLTFRALAAGRSDIAIAQEDLNQDGKLDRGALLRDVDGRIIGDSNGDSLFDGEMIKAQAAVGEVCESGTPIIVGLETEESGGGISTGVAIGAAVAGAVGIPLIAFLAFVIYRRRGYSTGA